MHEDERLRLMVKDVTEIVTREELESLVSEKEHPRAYIGFEPSGMMHIGQAINVFKVAEMTRAGVDFIIFLADWHAKINDKFGGDIDKIQACGEYMRGCFIGLGVNTDRTNFVYASEIVDCSEYWERMVQISKASSLSRIRRAMTIMGREEKDAELDFSKLIYPPMQVADIFELDVDIAYGGMDQRHAHMLARDVAEKLDWKKPIAMHSWLLPGLAGSGRMDASQNKMSKSDPRTSVIVTDPPDVISEKISAAYCPPEAAEDNPVLSIAERLIFPIRGEFILSRKERFGGETRFGTFSDLAISYVAGEIHPKDLKENVARELAEILQPVRDYFEKNPSSLSRLRELAGGVDL